MAKTEPDVVLYLRVPSGLADRLKILATRRARSYERANVNATCCELLATAAEAADAADMATARATVARVVRGPQLAIPTTKRKAVRK